MNTDLPDAILQYITSSCTLSWEGKVGHGPKFQEHEPRIKSVTNEIISKIRNR